jgi:exodeoxyribonuclease V beta subunit
VPGHDVFGFPKGAAAGTCLHAILERISFTDPADHRQIIADQLNRAGFDETWLDVTVVWMEDILKTELAGELTLSGLQDRDRVNEMSFYFPLQSLDLARFNRVLQAFAYAPLPDRDGSLQGLMVGFIDLVFRFNDRYYVADYKSNHLGSRAELYSPENLQAAMLDHRYDLQYLIYTLALHRFLQSRIRQYDYEQHFGSVLYLFLRGMHPKNATGTGVYTARPPLALIEQLDQCCAGLEVG